jgi:hypothetical protein
MILTAARGAQAQDTLVAGVFGNGGWAVTDSDYHLMIGTLGQPAVRSSTGSTMVLASGFWHSVRSITTGVDQNGELLPKTFVLHANYPNPFNPSTTIRFDLPKAGMARLIVYNILGQEVRSLANGRMEAGRHHVTWDGANDRGVRVSSGVYIYRLHYGDKIKSRKMMVLK